MSTISPATTPANTERRTTRNATKPQAMATEADAQRHAREGPGRKHDDLGDDAGEHRDRHRARPHEELGLLVDAAGSDEANHAPDLAGQKTDQHQQHIGMELAAHLRASRRR